MHVKMESGERYPVYSLARDDYPPEWQLPVIDVPDSTVERWRHVQAEYDAMQAEMAGYWSRYHEAYPPAARELTVRERLADEARAVGYASLAEAEDAGDLPALADRLGISLGDLD